MSSIFAYTFRTFPHIDQLRYVYPDLSVFSKLKKDIQSFCKNVAVQNPDYILGVARSRAETVIEPTAINNIHQHQIIRNGPNRVQLHVPTASPFKISKQPSNSFCNYSMYKIQYFLNQSRLDSKLIFVHISFADLPGLLKFARFIKNG